MRISRIASADVGFADLAVAAQLLEGGFEFFLKEGEHGKKG